MNVNWGANIGNVCTDVKGKLTIFVTEIFSEILDIIVIIICSYQARKCRSFIKK